MVATKTESYSEPINNGDQSIDAAGEAALSALDNIYCTKERPYDFCSCDLGQKCTIGQFKTLSNVKHKISVDGY